MAEIILRCTFGNRDDYLVYDDDTVTRDGILEPNAIVTKVDGVTRVALDQGNPTLLHINAYPEIAKIRITREPGWNDVLGWRAELLDIKEGENPGVVSIAVYQQSEATGYLFTTGAFNLNLETGLWEAVCPAGFEPGQDDIHFSMLYASIPYSAFSLWVDRDTEEFPIGGDL